MYLITTSLCLIATFFHKLQPITTYLHIGQKNGEKTLNKSSSMMTCSKKAVRRNNMATTSPPGPHQTSNSNGSHQSVPFTLSPIPCATNGSWRIGPNPDIFLDPQHICWLLLPSTPYPNLGKLGIEPIIHFIHHQTLLSSCFPFLTAVRRYLGLARAHSTLGC